MGYSGVLVASFISRGILLVKTIAFRRLPASIFLLLVSTLAACTPDPATPSTQPLKPTEALVHAPAPGAFDQQNEHQIIYATPFGVAVRSFE